MVSVYLLTIPTLEVYVNELPNHAPAHVAGSAATAASRAAAAPASWTQWGGPTRDFRVAGSPNLRDTWPAGGPKTV